MQTYLILISQSGEDAPTADILENSFASTPSLVRVSEAQYRIGLIGAFPQNRTALYIQPGVGQVPPAELYWANQNAIFLLTATDGQLDHRTVEIRVYD